MGLRRGGALLRGCTRSSRSLRVNSIPLKRLNSGHYSITLALQSRIRVKRVYFILTTKVVWVRRFQLSSRPPRLAPDGVLEPPKFRSRVKDRTGKLLRGTKQINVSPDEGPFVYKKNRQQKKWASCQTCTAFHSQLRQTDCCRRKSVGRSGWRGGQASQSKK